MCLSVWVRRNCNWIILELCSIHKQFVTFVINYFIEISPLTLPLTSWTPVVFDKFISHSTNYKNIHHYIFYISDYWDSSRVESFGIRRHIYYFESQPTFLKNIASPFSKLKSKLSKKARLNKQKINICLRDD